jgi:Transmembrane proteins 14C
MCLLGYVSLSYYKSGQLCKVATGASLVMAAALTAVMFKRYRETGAIFPALVFMVASGGMSLFYVWSLLAGPPPKGKQQRD